MNMSDPSKKWETFKRDTKVYLSDWAEYIHFLGEEAAEATTSIKTHIVATTGYNRLTSHCTRRVLTPLKGGFKVVNQIGEGAFGDVLLVERIDSKEQFVAKELRFQNLVEFEDPNDVVKSFINEYNVMKDVYSCPLCIQFHSFVRFSSNDNKAVWLMMEYAERGSLFDIVVESDLQTGNAMNEEQVQAVAVQVLLALSYMHSRHIIHRDIKPQNLLLTKTGVVKLADFNISEYKPRSLRFIESTNRSQKGSFRYMAPELFYSAGDHEDKSLISYNEGVDIWALGMTLLCLATGAPVFSPYNMNEIVSFLIYLITDSTDILVQRDMVEKFAAEVNYKTEPEKVKQGILAGYAALISENKDFTYRGGFIKELMQKQGLCEFIFETCLVVDAELRPNTEQAMNRKFLASMLDEAVLTLHEDDVKYDAKCFKVLRDL